MRDVTAAHRSTAGPPRRAAFRGSLRRDPLLVHRRRMRHDTRNFCARDYFIDARQRDLAKDAPVAARCVTTRTTIPDADSHARVEF